MESETAAKSNTDANPAPPSAADAVENDVAGGGGGEKSDDGAGDGSTAVIGNGAPDVGSEAEVTAEAEKPDIDMDDQDGKDGAAKPAPGADNGGGENEKSDGDGADDTTSSAAGGGDAEKGGMKRPIDEGPLPTLPLKRARTPYFIFSDEKREEVKQKVSDHVTCTAMMCYVHRPVSAHRAIVMLHAFSGHYIWGL